MEAPKLEGIVSKFFPFDPEKGKGGFGFVEVKGKEYFFNVRHCNIPQTLIEVGLKVIFETRRGFDKKRNEKVEQATNLSYAK